MIFDNIHDLNDGSLRIDEIMSYFEVKPADSVETWYMIYKRWRLPLIYNLSNKTKDDEDYLLEVGGNYLPTDFPLSFRQINTVGETYSFNDLVYFINV